MQRGEKKNMRLWHKDLIELLPRQQLLGQWRECCLIAKNIQEKGTPNHILVNKVMHYPIQHFITYTQHVVNEMRYRGYKVDVSRFKLYASGGDIKALVPRDRLFEGWHNLKYFVQCYMNLHEKYDCGGIPEEEWQPLDKCVREKLNQYSCIE